MRYMAIVIRSYRLVAVSEGITSSALCFYILTSKYCNLIFLVLLIVNVDLQWCDSVKAVVLLVVAAVGLAFLKD